MCFAPPRLPPLPGEVARASLEAENERLRERIQALETDQVAYQGSHRVADMQACSGAKLRSCAKAHAQIPSLGTPVACMMRSESITQYLTSLWRNCFV